MVFPKKGSLFSRVTEQLRLHLTHKFSTFRGSEDSPGLSLRLTASNNKCESHSRSIGSGFTPRSPSSALLPFLFLGGFPC